MHDQPFPDCFSSSKRKCLRFQRNGKGRSTRQRVYQTDPWTFAFAKTCFRCQTWLSAEAKPLCETTVKWQESRRVFVENRSWYSHHRCCYDCHWLFGRLMGEISLLWWGLSLGWLETQGDGHPWNQCWKNIWDIFERWDGYEMHKLVYFNFPARTCLIAVSEFSS